MQFSSSSLILLGKFIFGDYLFVLIITLVEKCDLYMYIENARRQQLQDVELHKRWSLNNGYTTNVVNNKSLRKFQH
jgi:hypothetical protein